jgi:vancomycin resistance protein YoaR
MSQTSRAIPLKLICLAIPDYVLAIVIAISSLLVVVIFSLLAYQIYFLDRTHWGVQINGQDASRMTRAEVRQLVTKEANALLSRSVTLVSNEGSFTLTTAELGAGVNIEKTVDLAFSVGRQGAFWADLNAQKEAVKTPVNIVPVITFDTGPANNILQNLTNALNRPAQNAKLTLHNDLSIEVTPAQTGQTVDIPASRDAIRRAILLRQQAPVKLVLYTTPPKIQDAETARAQLNALLNRPLVFTFEDRSWTLPPEALSGMLILQETRDANGIGRISVAFNQAALSTYFHNLALEINQRPIDAWLHLDTTSWSLIPIIESQTGYTLNVSAAIEMVTGLLQTPNLHQLELPVLIDPPAVDMNNTAQLGITHLIGSATSYFKGSSIGRMQNIQVAASKFHGLVIPPGATFSFNEYLGDVSVENGFVESLIIAGDRTAVGMGGGVCQVSTTAFKAAFFTGLEIVERWAHGYRVSWYETGSGPGLDATIYSPSVDLKFRNDTNSYILIQTETDLNAGTLTFNFYGSPLNRTVVVSDPEESNRIPHAPPIYQDDPTLKPGQVKQVDWAKDGVDVTVYRSVTENGQIIHQDTIFSRYRPWQAVFKVGPKKESAQP